MIFSVDVTKILCWLPDDDSKKQIKSIIRSYE